MTTKFTAGETIVAYLKYFESETDKLIIDMENNIIEPIIRSAENFNLSTINLLNRCNNLICN